MELRIAAIIPNRNGREEIPRCLNSLLAQDPAPPDIIVVDDCSEDGSADMIKWHYPSVMILEMEKRVGFGQAASFGIRAADHDIVVVMNYDTFVRPGWLQELIDTYGDKAEKDTGRQVLVYLDEETAAPAGGGETAEGESAPEPISMDPALKDELDKKSAGLDAANEEIQRLQNVIRTQKEKLREKSGDRYEKAISEGRLSSLEQQAEKLNAELERERETKEELQEKARQADILRSRLEEKDDELKESMKRAEEMWRETGELREKSKRVDSLEKELDSAAQRINDLENRRQEAEQSSNETIRKKDQELQDANQRIFELTSVVSEMDAGRKLSERESEISENFLADFRNDYEKRISEKDETIQEKTELLAQKEKELEELRRNAGEIAEKESENEELRRNISDLEEKLVEKSNRITEKDNELEAAETEMDELKKAEAGARTKCDALEADVTDGIRRENDLKQQINRMEKEFSGRLEERKSELHNALDKIDKLEKEIDELIEVNNRLVGDIEEKNSKRENERRKFSEQLEEIRSEYDNELLDREEELRVAERRIESFRDEVASLKEDQRELEQLRKQAPDDQRQKKELETKLNTLRESLGGKLKEKDRELKQARESVNDLQRTVAGLENKSRSFARIASENEGYRKRAAKLERTIGELNDSFKKRMQEKDFILEQASNRLNELIISYRQLKGIDEEKKALEARCGELETMARRMESGNEKLDTQIEEMSEEIERLRNENKDLMSAVQSEKEMRAELEKFLDQRDAQQEEDDGDADEFIPSLQLEEMSDSLSARIEKSITEAEQLLGTAAEIKQTGETQQPAPKMSVARETKQQSEPQEKKQPKKKVKIKNPEKLIQAILNKKDPELLILLRNYYMERGRQNEGVGLLKKIIYGDETQALLPAVSLLLGELYGKMGRDKDADYYLSNPMIKYDEIAKRVTQKTGIKIPT